jgi:hypothetical protein
MDYCPLTNTLNADFVGINGKIAMPQNRGDRPMPP